VWKRVEWATRVAERAGRVVDARRLAEQSLGPLVGSETAKQLELSRAHVYNLINALGLERPRAR